MGSEAKSRYQNQSGQSGGGEREQIIPGAVAQQLEMNRNKSPINRKNITPPPQQVSGIDGGSNTNKVNTVQNNFITNNTNANTNLNVVTTNPRESVISSTVSAKMDNLERDIKKEMNTPTSTSFDRRSVPLNLQPAGGVVPKKTSEGSMDYRKDRFMKEEKISAPVGDTTDNNKRYFFPGKI